MEPLRDKFIGSLLGTMLGDAVGAPWEGTDGEQIAAVCDSYPFLLSREQTMNRAIFGLLLDDNTAAKAHYTDDTQMTLALAETLAETGSSLRSGHDVDFEAELATRFADAFDPARGYGPGAQSVLLAIRRGAPWNEPASRLFGGSGSFGNGAAMRAAPVGLFFHDAPQALLRDVARRSALPTHTHPQAIEGAIFQAAAVASACRYTPSSTFNPHAFLDAVEKALDLDADENTEYSDACQQIRQLLAFDIAPATIGDVLGCDVSAVGSVPTALYSFLTHPGNFKEAVTYAVKIGGDTDTIAAMCGAVSGAYLGASALPSEWLSAVENGLQGRDYAADLANRLFAAWRDASVLS